MKRIIRLTESDLTRIIKRVISEQSPESMEKVGIQQITSPAELATYTPYFNGEDLDIVMRDKNGNTIYYKCVTDPYYDAGFKTRKLTNPDTKKLENIPIDDPDPAGRLMDANGKIYKKNSSGGIDGTLIKNGWESFAKEACKVIYQWRNRELAGLEKYKEDVAAKKVNTKIAGWVSQGCITKKSQPDGTIKYFSTAKTCTINNFQIGGPNGKNMDVTNIITM